MICLGIESTAHTFGAGVIDSKGNILSNVKDMYRPPAGWGIDPGKAKQHHIELADKIITQALIEAGISPTGEGTKHIDIIAYSRGPGLPPCLHVGRNKAVEYAKKFDIPVVPVNHCIAHLEIGKLLAKFNDPVMLYVSGGNTQVIAFESGRYRVFGETEDIGVGNLLDAFGRKAKIDFPAGPRIEQLAKNGKYIELPYSVKGMDVAFSGIKTKLENMIGKHKIEDLCYSLQETCFAMLVEVSERAMAHCQKNELILTGGVAANKRLAEMCSIMCKERDSGFFQVPIQFAGDQGAMIAWNGILAKELATKNYDKLDIDSNWRTDEVDIAWK